MHIGKIGQFFRIRVFPQTNVGLCVPGPCKTTGDLQNTPGTPAMHFPLVVAGSQSALYCTHARKHGRTSPCTSQVSGDRQNGTQARRHLKCRKARARARTQKQVPTPVEVLGREQPRRRSGASRAQGLHWVVHLPLGCKMNSSLQMQMNSSLRASVS
jgi:hypothetical protein